MANAQTEINKSLVVSFRLSGYALYALRARTMSVWRFKDDTFKDDTFVEGVVRLITRPVNWVIKGVLASKLCVPVSGFSGPP